jgi:Branched-chain amino acid aminotransferase/4-amino-4-deoxychorismate lyase
MYAIVNDEIVPVSQATVHVSDLALQRGYGIFDFFKVSDGHVFFMDDYLDRFFHSASVMRLPIPLDRERLRQLIFKLIEKNALRDSGIKMILTGGYSPDGYQISKPNLIMVQQALTLPGPEILKTGVRIITHDYVREFAHAKTINYSMGIWLIEEIRRANAADMLYQKDGWVSEFPRCNFFIVKKDNTVVTPSNNVLRGVTRKNVLRIASEAYQTEERDVHLDEVFDAKEAFLTSTTKRVVPIVAIDGRNIGNGQPGEVSLTLFRKLLQLEENDRKENHSRIV